MKIRKNDYLSRNIPDLLLILGLGCLNYGLFCIYPPAMWVADGLILLFLGYPRKGAE